MSHLQDRVIDIRCAVCRPEPRGTVKVIEPVSFAQLMNKRLIWKDYQFFLELLAVFSLLAFLLFSWFPVIFNNPASAKNVQLFIAGAIIAISGKIYILKRNGVIFFQRLTTQNLCLSVLEFVVLLSYFAVSSMFLKYAGFVSECLINTAYVSISSSTSSLRAVGLSVILSILTAIAATAGAYGTVIIMLMLFGGT